MFRCHFLGTTVEVTHNISLDDLLGDVDRKTFYRYNGSLTTPPCNEAVVWTIFKHPVKVDKDLVSGIDHMESGVAGNASFLSLKNQ